MYVTAEFERRIVAHNQGNSKFNFLHPSDTYYQHCIAVIAAFRPKAEQLTVRLPEGITGEELNIIKRSVQIVSPRTYYVTSKFSECRSVITILGDKIKLFQWSQQTKWLEIATHPECPNNIHRSTRWSSLVLCSRSELEGFYAAPSRNSRRMPGSICISAIQPPVTTPLFLQVVVGKREYSGNIGQDGFSFPVTSFRDTMVMALYNADKKLLSKAELKTKAIVESGTMDAVFTLDSGAKITLQLQLLLSDEDRKRIQEMRNSVMKRKQQELLGSGYQFYAQDGLLSKQLTEMISDIPSKGDQPTLRKSISLDDLKESDVLSGASVEPPVKASRDTLLQSGGKSPRHENPIDSKMGHRKPESRSRNAVKNMISAFESSSSQGLPSVTRIKSETSLKRGTVNQRVDQEGWSSRSGKHVMFGNRKTNTCERTSLSNTYESRRRSSSRRDGAAKQSTSEVELNRSKKRSQEKRRSSIGPYSLERMHPPTSGLSRYYDNPSNYLAATSNIWIHPHVCITTASRQLKDLLDLEHLNVIKYIEQVDDSKMQDIRGEGIEESTSDDEMRDAMAHARQKDGFPMLDGWIVNQGVRVVIVIIACGAVFFNR